MLLVRLMLVAVMALVSLMLEASSGLPMKGDEAETFLRDAGIVAMTPIGVGITKADEGLVERWCADTSRVWKTIDEVRHGVEIEAVLARRDLLVELATTLAAGLGDDAIYYP